MLWAQETAELCAALGAGHAARGGEVGAGSKSHPGTLCWLWADGCELVFLHSSALCTGQLTWNSLRQAPFFTQEMA